MLCACKMCVCVCECVTVCVHCTYVSVSLCVCVCAIKVFITRGTLIIYLSLTPVDNNLCFAVAGQTNPWSSCIGDVLLESCDLECGKDRGVVAGHDVRSTSV